VTLAAFRLSEGQGDDSFVVVLADDGRVRVIARVSREAIDDCFQRRELTQRQRVALVESNLPHVARLIERKYLAGDHTIYTDRLGITDESNRLIIITYDDLSRGERLSDARLQMEEKAHFSAAFSGMR
jgi:hypothetical protein